MSTGPVPLGRRYGPPSALLCDAGPLVPVLCQAGRAILAQETAMRHTQRMGEAPNAVDGVPLPRAGLRGRTLVALEVPL